MCLCHSIVNIRTQGMQGNLPFNLFLGARYFRSTQPPSHNDPDTFGVGSHRFLYRLLHSTAERDTLLQLFGNAACNQVGI
jgi:hypothetical protein